MVNFTLSEFTKIMIMSWISICTQWAPGCTALACHKGREQSFPLFVVLWSWGLRAAVFKGCSYWDGIGEMWAGLQGTMWHREGSACSLETHRSCSAEQCDCYQSAHGLISEHRGVLSRNAGEYLEAGHPVWVGGEQWWQFGFKISQIKVLSFSMNDLATQDNHMDRWCHYHVTCMELGSERQVTFPRLHS